MKHHAHDGAAAQRWHGCGCGCGCGGRRRRPSADPRGVRAVPAEHDARGAGGGVGDVAAAHRAVRGLRRRRLRALRLGEVVGVHIDESLLEDGVYQTERARPIMRGGGPGDYFTITEANKFFMGRPE